MRLSVTFCDGVAGADGGVAGVEGAASAGAEGGVAGGSEAVVSDATSDEVAGVSAVGVVAASDDSSGNGMGRKMGVEVSRDGEVVASGAGDEETGPGLSARPGRAADASIKRKKYFLRDIKWNYCGFSSLTRRTIGMGMSSGGGSCNCSPIRTSFFKASSTAGSPVVPEIVALMTRPVLSAQIRVFSP